ALPHRLRSLEEERCDDDLGEAERPTAADAAVRLPSGSGAAARARARRPGTDRSGLRVLRAEDEGGASGPDDRGQPWSDGVVQPAGHARGRVLFEWHSWPAVGLAESYAPAPKPPKEGKKAPPYDYFHINSVELEQNGNYLISARNTHTVYEIDGKTGKILWRLGGKKSDFKMGQSTKFAWQHDARLQPDGTITLFDNGAAPPVEKFTRILVLKVDENAKTATLVRSYSHPKKLLVPFEGNAQFLPDGHVFVGWGAVPYFTEFDAQGHAVFDVSFG